VKEAKRHSKSEWFQESWTVLNIRALGQTYSQSCRHKEINLNSTAANVSNRSWPEVDIVALLGKIF
jgi:hypothetical protein